MQPTQYLMTGKESTELYCLISRFWNRFPWKFSENHSRLKSYPEPMAIRFSEKKRIIEQDFIRHKEQTTISVRHQWIL